MFAATVRFTACLLLIYLCPLWLVASRAEWPSEARFVCDDPLFIRQQSFFVSWFPRPGAVIEKIFLTEKYQVVIDQKHVNSGEIRFGVPFMQQDVQLDRDRLSLLRLVVRKRSQDSDLPYWSTGSIKLGAYILTAGESQVVTSIFKFLFEIEKIEHARISAVEAFLAEGGELLQIGRIDSGSKGHLVATETIVYRVALGKEYRSFLLYSCAYPARIVMRKVRTVEPPTNPKIYEDVGPDWVMKDARTGAVEMHLKKTQEDSEFYYFLSGAREYRVSRVGGPIELNLFGKWTQLYQKTTVE